MPLFIPYATLLILLSLAAGVFAIYSYRKKINKSRQDRLLSLFLYALIGGIISLSFTLFALKFISALFNFALLLSWSLAQQALYHIFFTGPLEEFSKLFAAFITYKIINNKFSEQMNNPIDALLQMANIALGFSLIENIIFASVSQDVEFILLLRLIISTPAHILFTLFMAEAYYNVQKNNAPFYTLIAPWAVASLAHGLFNAIPVFELSSSFLIIYLTFLAYLINMKYKKYLIQK